MINNLKSMNVDEEYNKLLKEIIESWSDRAIESLCHNPSDIKIRDEILKYKKENNIK